MAAPEKVNGRAELNDAAFDEKKSHSEYWEILKEMLLTF
jgi:hypothetical protein